jgi:hypothetical protein
MGKTRKQIADEQYTAALRNGFELINAPKSSDPRCDNLTSDEKDSSEDATDSDDDFSNESGIARIIF